VGREREQAEVWEDGWLSVGIRLWQVKVRVEEVNEIGKVEVEVKEVEEELMERDSFFFLSYVV
jgi:hypothetical protein